VAGRPERARQARGATAAGVRCEAPARAGRGAAAAEVKRPSPKSNCGEGLRRPRGGFDIGEAPARTSGLW
jgi:hypothetical protein